ncbi:DMT family transporter [Pseudodonghicola xiamenensis]|uniref:Membrane protein n=1 Tax=Pseudodonghicola xiamenensis TaxID=337702 RepID=A0A8J3MAL6_9RHOB|nr:DMT family transporter [Pseudodonghicola xiamenensis]GHG80170.1 membrane protein [Pseudodonghicola xiamenensis]
MSLMAEPFPMENLRGAVLMTVAMLGFAVEDVLIKLLADRLPGWEIMLFLGAGAATIFAVLTRASGRRLWTRGYLRRPVLIRNGGELVSSFSMIMALALAPLSVASAILQANPLLVTLGAAIFLGEPVGWRRWGAILVGFVGVLLVVQPGGAGFEAPALFAVAAAISLAVRDLATRVIARETTSFQVSFLAFALQVPSALILSTVMAEPFVRPDMADGLKLVGVVALGAVSYHALVSAMRAGEVSFVTPFRYTRILFALGFAFVVFSERPNGLMLFGTGIIVASGIYTLWRERKHRLKA